MYIICGFAMPVAIVNVYGYAIMKCIFVCLLIAAYAYMYRRGVTVVPSGGGIFIDW